MSPDSGRWTWTRCTIRRCWLSEGLDLFSLTFRGGLYAACAISKAKSMKAFAPSWITRAFRSSACVSLSRCLGSRPGCSDMHSCRASPAIVDAASHAARRREARRVVSCGIASALRDAISRAWSGKCVSGRTARREPPSGLAPGLPQPQLRHRAACAPRTAR